MKNNFIKRLLRLNKTKLHQFTIDDIIYHDGLDWAISNITQRNGSKIQNISLVLICYIGSNQTQREIELTNIGLKYTGRKL